MYSLRVSPAPVLLGGTLLLSCALLFGCATAESALRDTGASPLPASTLLTLFTSGKPMKYRLSDSGAESTVRYNRDGSAVADWESTNDVGRWRIAENAFCTKWNSEGGTPEKCFHAYRTGENEYTVFGLDGSRRGAFSLQE